MLEEYQILYFLKSLDIWTWPSSDCYWEKLPYFEGLKLQLHLTPLN